MSVLVKGMSIPRSCRECGFYRVRYDIGYYDYEVCMGNEQIFNDGYDNTKPHIDPFTEKLENCPLVEQPERKRGRLEYVDYGGFGNWHCTACRQIIICNGDYDFCPYCGADLREGEQDG